MASDVHTIRRFSATERWVHWIHAAAFFVLLGSGLVLYLPSLASAVGHLSLAVIHPSTRHALRGMTTGSVDRHWALRHHEKWVRTPGRGDGEADDRDGEARRGLAAVRRSQT